MNGRDHFWNSAQLAEFVDAIGGQDCLVIHFFLANPDPAQLVTDYSDILFSGLHNGRYYFFYDTIKRCFFKNTVFYHFFEKSTPGFACCSCIQEREKPGTKNVHYLHCMIKEDFFYKYRFFRNQSAWGGR